MTARAALAIWTLALACAAVAIALIATGDHTDGKVALIALAVPTELAFVASGIVARLQRPHNRTGVLLILVGFSWFLGALTTAGNPYVFTAGLALGTVFTALLAHLFLAFPTGRLATRVDRALAAGLLRGRPDRPDARIRLRRGRADGGRVRRALPGQPPCVRAGPDRRDGDRRRLRRLGRRSRAARPRSAGPPLAAGVTRAAARACAGVGDRGRPHRARGRADAHRARLHRGGRGDQLARSRRGPRRAALVSLRPAAVPLRSDDAAPRRRAVGEAHARGGAGRPAAGAA